MLSIFICSLDANEITNETNVKEATKLKIRHFPNAILSEENATVHFSTRALNQLWKHGNGILIYV